MLRLHGTSVRDVPSSRWRVANSLAAWRFVLVLVETAPKPIDALHEAFTLLVLGLERHIDGQKQVNLQPTSRLLRFRFVSVSFPFRSLGFVAVVLNSRLMRIAVTC